MFGMLLGTLTQFKKENAASQDIIKKREEITTRAAERTQAAQADALNKQKEVSLRVCGRWAWVADCFVLIR